MSRKIRAGRQYRYLGASNSVNEGIVVTVLYPYEGNEWSFKNQTRWVIDRFVTADDGSRINHLLAERLYPTDTVVNR